jgi:hypothetical protein
LTEVHRSKPGCFITCNSSERQRGRRARTASAVGRSRTHCGERQV